MPLSCHKTVSAFDSSATWVGVSRCEIESYIYSIVLCFVSFVNKGFVSGMDCCDILRGRKLSTMKHVGNI